MRKALTVAVTAFALACLVTPSWARAQTMDQAAGAAVRAVIANDATGVVIRYQLPAPVQRFVFADRDIIRTLWTVTTPGLTLTDGAVTSDQPFDAFVIRIRPDAAEVDRVYMGLSRAGDGHVVYGPGLKAEDGVTVLGFDPAEDETGLPESGAIDGYAYLGSSAQVTAGAQGAVITGANVAPELAAPLRQSFFDSMAFYEAQLGTPLPFRPALIASVDSPGPTSFRGDVTDTGVISLRFHGDAWRGATEFVLPFVWHETFHLWNGHGVENRDAEAAPWLHEGGAEYAALVGAVSVGGMTEDQARTGLARRVNGCRRTLASRDLDPARLRSGSGPYDCGVLIQWLADLEARKAGSGNVFSQWKGLLDAARADPGGYGVDDFRARLAPDSAVSVLLDGPGAGRWEAVQTRLADLGVLIENRPGDEDLLGAALFHVAGRNCKGGSYGFYNVPGALKLDGASCGPLSGEPVIATVEALDPQTESRAMFDAVQARCAARLPVRYRTRDDRVLEAVCDTPLATPIVWAIAAAPPLSILEQNLSTVIK